MKKTTLLLAFALAHLTMFANDDRRITVEQLPQPAQQFIQKYFPGSIFGIAKVEKDILDKSYEVKFNNGNKVEFDKKGKWTEVECDRGEVPATVVPQPIMDYVKSSYPGAKIEKIERHRGRYEVELSGKYGVELTFNKKFKLVDIDR